MKNRSKPSGETKGDADLSNLSAVFSSAAVVDDLKKVAPGIYAAADAFWRAAHVAPALTPRMKELVLLALHGTVTALDSEGLKRHIARALDAGASALDVLDVLTTIVGAANHALYFALPILMRELKDLGHVDAELPPVTPRALQVKDEFVKARGFWNEQRDIILQAMPEYFAALSQLSMKPWQEGSLSDMERELVCIAIDSTVTHMFQPGLVIHIRHALQKGATREHITEVFQLASVIGLEGYIVGAEELVALKK